MKYALLLLVLTGCTGSKIHNGDSIQIVATDHLELVQQAAHYWAAVGANLQFTEKSAYTITIHFEPGKDCTDQGAPACAAFVLDPEAPQSWSNDVWIDLTQYPFTSERLQPQALAHELGHAVGMVHNVNAVMDPDVAELYQELQTADLEEYAKLYP
jgi:hypothetical protein